MRAIRLEGTYLIRAPREAVYALLTDFAHVPEHFPKVALAARELSRDADHVSVDVTTRAFAGSGTFAVHMEAELHPPAGFTSTNTSAICVEQEEVVLEEVPEGTRMVYRNDVTIHNPLFALFAGLLFRRLALRYWERQLIDAMRSRLEPEAAGG